MNRRIKARRNSRKHKKHPENEKREKETGKVKNREFTYAKLVNNEA